MEGAAATYFKSLHDSSSRAKTGKLERHGTLCRRQGRRRDVSFSIMMINIYYHTTLLRGVQISHNIFVLFSFSLFPLPAPSPFPHDGHVKDVKHWQVRIFTSHLYLACPSDSPKYCLTLKNMLQYYILKCLLR